MKERELALKRAQNYSKTMREKLEEKQNHGMDETQWFDFEKK